MRSQGSGIAGVELSNDSVQFLPTANLTPEVTDIRSRQYITTCRCTGTTIAVDIRGENVVSACEGISKRHSQRHRWRGTKPYRWIQIKPAERSDNQTGAEQMRPVISGWTKVVVVAVIIVGRVRDELLTTGTACGFGSGQRIGNRIVDAVQDLVVAKAKPRHSLFREPTV